MKSAKERIAQFMHVEDLQKYGECAYYVEWDSDNPDKKKEPDAVLCAVGFNVGAIDEERDIALVTASSGVAHFPDQHRLLEDLEWLDCFSEVMLVKLPKEKPEDEDGALFWESFMANYSVSFDVGDEIFLVYHRANQVASAIHNYKMFTKKSD
jgi:hypothetical protein